MAKPKHGLNWRHDTLTPTLGLFVVRANFAISAAAKELADRIEEWMKENAPWEDRTGDARDGLGAAAEHEGFKQNIYLYHTVDYGIWLEIRWGGKYAVIVPAMEHFQNQELWVHFDPVMAEATLGGRSSILL